MIQRRVLVTLLAATAIAGATGCKQKSEDKPAPNPTPGSGSATTVTGSGPALTGSAERGASPTGDSGSAMPPPGGAITQPFFYKVEKAGKTSYLLGTWHVGIDAGKQMPKPVWDAFDQSTTFAMEANPGDQAGLDAFNRSDGKTLEQDLGPEYWAKLEAQVDPDALAKLNKMKVFAATVQLQYRDLPTTTPMDMEFSNRAATGKKQMVFLEQYKTQLKLIEKWVDLRVLKSTIDDYTETRNKIDVALAAYMVGDDAALASMVVDRESLKKAGFSDAEVDAFGEELLHGRNAAWLPALQELFTAGGAFVAVGAGHLIGPKSVVELLQAKGFAVTRVGA